MTSESNAGDRGAQPRRSFECAMALGVSLLVGATAGASGAAAGGADLATYTNSSGDGLWSNADNWFPLTVPNNGGGFTFDVDIPAGNTCDLNMNAAIETLLIGLNSDLAILDARTLTITGNTGGGGTEGSVVINGLMTMGSVGNVTNFAVGGGGTMTIGNGASVGEIQMSNFSTNRIYGNSGTETIWIRENNLVHGGGDIGRNLTTLQNDGEIWADVSTPLTIDPNAGGFLNNGTLGARFGATLRLAPGAYESPIGIGELIVEDASTIEMNAVTLTESEMFGSGSGVFNVTGDTTSFLSCVLEHVLNIQDARSPRFVDSFVNNGTVNMLSLGNVTRIYIDDTGSLIVPFTGGGTINMSNFTTNRIQGWNGNETFHNVDNLIRGSGDIGVNTLGLINDSLIVADQTATLRIDPNGDGMVNNGTLRAIGPGRMIILPATYENAAGLFDAVSSGVIDLSAATILGGLLTDDGTGTYNVVADTLSFQDVEFTSTMRVLDARSPRLVDSFINSGVVNLLSAGNVTRLYIDNDATDGVVLSGGGVVNLSNFSTNRIHGWNGNETFENLDNLIRGSGDIGGNGMTVINRGEIRGDQSVALSIDPGGGGFLNEGICQAIGGGHVQVFGGGFFDNTNGVFEASGSSEIELRNGAICLNDGNTINVFDDSVMSFRTSSVIGGSIHGDPAATFIAHSGTNDFEDLSFDGNMTVTDAADLRLIDDIVNTGRIEFASLGNVTRLYVDNNATGGARVSGGGEIVFGTFTTNRLQGWNGNETFENVDNLIRGGGTIGVNTVALINGGIIQADLDATMSIDPAVTMVNTGELRTNGSSTLNLLAATYDNAGGLIQANDGGVVNFVAATIRDGAVRSNGTGVLQVTGDSSAFISLAISGTLNVVDSRSPRFVDDIDNDATITLNSLGNVTRMYIDNESTDGVQLTGIGTIEMVNSSTCRIQGWNGNETLTNVSNTIRGRGQIGLNTMSLHNQGSIIADLPGGFTIDVNGFFLNEGIVRVDPGSQIIMNDVFVQDGNGVLDLRDTLDFNGASLLDINNGTLRGTGPVLDANTESAGITSPGDGIGTLVLDGSFAQEDGGILEVQIAGPTPDTQHDVLDVATSVSLDGNLRVRFIDDFEPKIGSEYTIITGTSVSGTFDDVYGDGTFTVIYEPTEVRVVVDSFVQSCNGDITLDGVIDVNDLLLILANWGTNGVGSDIAEPSNLVDVNDLLTILAFWGPCL